jgi:(p)ppGpp synthase/HD superfamily hydrolase
MTLRDARMAGSIPRMSDQPIAGVRALVGDSDRLAAAYRLAQEAHAGQQRKDNGAPYLTHPLRVAQVVRDAGFDEDTVAAALLHDVVEDSGIGLPEISRELGPHVAEIVSALTEDEGIEDYEERKAEHRDRVEAAGTEAVAIYTADKLSNLRDMRGLYGLIGERAAERFTAPLDLRSRLWLEDSAMAERALPDRELAAELRAEAEGFVRDRGAAPATR